MLRRGRAGGLGGGEGRETVLSIFHAFQYQQLTVIPKVRLQLIFFFITEVHCNKNYAIY